LILILFGSSTGKFFMSDGSIYEGDWKDSYKDGQGKKDDLLI